MTEDQYIKKVIAEVNKSMVWYKRGGWIDARRTPEASENYVKSLTEFIEARFNRECFDIPELQDVFDMLGGQVWLATLEDPDEERKRYKQATLQLVDPEKRHYIKDDDSGEYLPVETVKELLERVRKFFGGNKVTFNSVKVKIKYNIENE